MNKAEKPRFFFTILDDEILDDCLIALSCDDHTWLYEPKRSVHNNGLSKNPAGDSSGIYETSQSGGVDSRTYCRRRKSHYSLGMSPFPSLEVADVNLSTRSSLGILNGSLNDTLMGLGEPGKSLCDFTASDVSHSPAAPVFKLDAPFVNEPPPVLKPIRQRYEITRLDSESLEDSVPLSLKNDFSLERNSVMTSSMMRFVSDRSKPSRETAPKRQELKIESMADGPTSTIESMTGSVLLSAEMTDSTASDAENVPPPLTPLSAPAQTGQTIDNRLSERIVTPEPEYIVPNDTPSCPAEKEALNLTFTLKRSLGSGDDSDRSLNNKDMNRTYDLAFANLTNEAMTRTFTRDSPPPRSNLPGRRTTFNSTFTRLPVGGLNDRGSTGSLDGDRASNASDSSCDGRGHEPRSVEDLRAEACRQQAVLDKQSHSTSTPDSTKPKKRSDDREESPQLSPVHNFNPATITRPAAALSKVRKPVAKTSAVVVNGHAQRFIPEPASGVGRRPSTAPLQPTASAIPRPPMRSRLPMPKLKPGFPMAKRGGLH